MTRVQDFDVEAEAHQAIALAVPPKKYDEVEDLIENSERRPRVVIDGKEQVLRCHKLPFTKLEKICAKWRESGQFVSPYSKGVYTYTLLALWELGPNQAHRLSDILRVMKRTMTGAKGKNGLNDWERYYEKRSGAANALDPMGKLWQNLRQFVRYGGMNPYGEKLRQMGVVIDRFEDNHGHKYARMNTYAYRGTEMTGGKIKVKTTAPRYEDVPTTEQRSTGGDSRPIHVPSFPSIVKKAAWTLGPSANASE